MSFLLDDIIRVKAFFAFTDTPFDRTLNVFHYRCSEAGGSSDLAVDLQAFYATFASEVMAPMLTNMSTSTNCVQVRIARIDPVESWEYVKDIPIGDAPGSLTDVTDQTAHSRAACFVRRSYAVGRHGIGRTFFGPLCAEFQRGDYLVIDPALTGDLNDVATAFNAILEPADTGVFKPNIWGPVGAAPLPSKAERDQRTGAFTPLLSYLRTRKPGRGS